MLTLEETQLLVAVIQSSGSTLDDVLNKFKKNFAPDSHPRVTLALHCILEDLYCNTNFSATAGATQSEMLIVYFLLWTLAADHGNDATPLPNTRSLLYEQLQKLDSSIRDVRERQKKEREEKSGDKKSPDAEWEEEEGIRTKQTLKLFIMACICGKMTGDRLKTVVPSDLLRHEITNLEKEVTGDSEALRTHLKELKAAFDEEKKNTIGGFLGCGISGVLTVPNEDSNPGSSETPLSVDREMTVLRFEPVMDRPRPPPLPTQAHELSFLHSEGYYSDLFFIADPIADAALELNVALVKATRTTLDAGQQEELLRLARTHPGLLPRSGLTPQALTALVQHNVDVAEELIRLLKSAEHEVVVGDLLRAAWEARPQQYSEDTWKQFLSRVGETA